jgi:type I restriction enzyme, S subunit
MRDEWEALSLADVLEPVRRKLVLDQETFYRPIGVRWYGNGPFLKQPKLGSQIAAKSMNLVQPGDIVYSKLFAWKGSFGVIDEGFQGAVASGEFPTFVADRNRLDPDFFPLWARRKEVWEAADEASTGTTAGSRNRLAQDDFLNLGIDLPPLWEQQAIVAAVGKVINLESRCQAEAQACKKLLDSAREHLLHTWNWGELPKNWNLFQLGDVAEVRSGLAKGRAPRGDLVDRPFIRAANVQDGFLNLSEIKTLAVSQDEFGRFRLEKSDLLLTEGGNAEHVGRGWLWEEQVQGAICQNHVFRVRADKRHLVPRFLAYAVGSSPIRTYCLNAAKKTTNLASINKSQISAMPIPVPPLEIQEEIVRQLDAMRGFYVQASDMKERAGRLRAALAERFLDGKIAPPAAARK